MIDGIRAAFDFFVRFSTDYWGVVLACEVLAPFVALIVLRKILTIMGILKR